MSNTEDKKVEVFHRLNKLKAKTGIPIGIKIPGHIEPDAVKKAQSAIDEKEEQCLDQFKALLENHEKTWEQLKAAGPDERETLLAQAHNYANNIKDLAETYNYDVLIRFGTQLRDFYEKIDIDNSEHHIVVETHIDAMNAEYKKQTD